MEQPVSNERQRIIEQMFGLLLKDLVNAAPNPLGVCSVSFFADGSGEFINGVGNVVGEFGSLTEAYQVADGLRNGTYKLEFTP